MALPFADAGTFGRSLARPIPLDAVLGDDAYAVMLVRQFPGKTLAAVIEIIRAITTYFFRRLKSMAEIPSFLIGNCCLPYILSENR